MLPRGSVKSKRVLTAGGNIHKLAGDTLGRSLTFVVPTPARHPPATSKTQRGSLSRGHCDEVASDAILILEETKYQANRLVRQ